MSTFTRVLSEAAVPLLIVGGGTFALVKWGHARALHALLFLIGGFYLAKSSLAPYIDTFLGRIPGLFGWHVHIPATQVTVRQAALMLPLPLRGLRGGSPS
jgi:hypothetical protein